MGSIVVGLVIIAIVAFVINSMIKDKKSGKPLCGCSCANCACKCSKGIEK